VSLLIAPAVRSLNEGLREAISEASLALGDSRIGPPLVDSAEEVLESDALPLGARSTTPATAASGATPAGDGAAVAAPPPGAPVSVDQQEVVQERQVATRRVVLRGSPGGAVVADAVAGTELRTLEYRDDWRRVELPSGFRGWISKAELAPPPIPAGALRLTFSDAQAGITHYEVHYGTEPGRWTHAMRFDARLRAGLVTGLTSGTRYYLVMKAANAGGVSAPTAEISHVAN
jgi:hypothetical protein